MLNIMSFNEWMFSVHRITPEMYEKRSIPIKDAINDEYKKYRQKEMYHDKYDLYTQLSKLEAKLQKKKELLNQVMTNEKTKKNLHFQIIDLERKIKEKENEIEREDAYNLLASIGVPIGPDGEPLGIGDD